MSSDRSADATIEAPYVSTGRLPSPDIVRALVSDAHERFGTNRDGQVSDVYPALASVPQDLFGLCVVGVSGAVLRERRLGHSVLDHERVEAVCVRIGLAGPGRGRCAPAIGR